MHKEILLQRLRDRFLLDDLTGATPAFVADDDIHDADGVGSVERARITALDDPRWDDLLAPTKEWLNIAVWSTTTGEKVLAVEVGRPVPMPEGWDISIHLSESEQPLAIVD